MENNTTKQPETKKEAKPDQAARQAYVVLEGAITQAMGNGLFKRFADLDACRQALQIFKDNIAELEKSRAEKSN